MRAASILGGEKLIRSPVDETDGVRHEFSTRSCGKFTHVKTHCYSVDDVENLDTNWIIFEMITVHESIRPVHLCRFDRERFRCRWTKVQRGLEACKEFLEAPVEIALKVGEPCTALVGEFVSVFTRLVPIRCSTESLQRITIVIAGMGANMTPVRGEIGFELQPITTPILSECLHFAAERRSDGDEPDEEDNCVRVIDEPTEDIGPWVVLQRNEVLVSARPYVAHGSLYLKLIDKFTR